MAKKFNETYEIVLAHAGRRDEVVTESVTVHTQKEYNAVTDRIFEMNVAMGVTADKAYYGIRRAA